MGERGIYKLEWTDFQEQRKCLWTETLHGARKQERAIKRSYRNTMDPVPEVELTLIELPVEVAKHMPALVKWLNRHAT